MIEQACAEVNVIASRDIQEDGFYALMAIHASRTKRGKALDYLP